MFYKSKNRLTAFAPSKFGVGHIRTMARRRFLSAEKSMWCIVVTRVSNVTCNEEDPPLSSCLLFFDDLIYRLTKLFAVASHAFSYLSNSSLLITPSVTDHSRICILVKFGKKKKKPLKKCAQDGVQNDRIRFWAAVCRLPQPTTTMTMGFNQFNGIARRRRWRRW